DYTNKNIKIQSKLCSKYHAQGVSNTGAVYFPANGAHPAIHHVAGRHNVPARFRVTGRGAGEEFERRVVENFRAAPVLANDAAMAVFHVFAEANVGDDEQLRKFLFQSPHRLLNNAVGRERAAG